MNFSRPTHLLKSQRFWIGLGVSGLWIAMMVLLWVRQAGGSGAALRRMGVAPEVLMVTWQGYSHDLWIEQRGRRIGATHLSIVAETPEEMKSVRTGRMPGYRMDSRTRLQLELLGTALPADVALKVRMNSAMEMETLQAALWVDQRRFLIEGFVQNSSLYYQLRSESAGQGAASGLSGALGSLLGSTVWAKQGDLAGGGLCGRSPLDGPIILSDVLLPMLVHTEQFRPGLSWTTVVSDPLGGRLRVPVRVTVEGEDAMEVNGRTIHAWRLRDEIHTDLAGEMGSRSWYDDQGRLLRQELKGGLTLTQASAADITQWDPSFYEMPGLPKLDREAILSHVAPELDGKRLQELLPAMPGI